MQQDNFEKEIVNIQDSNVKELLDLGQHLYSLFHFEGFLKANGRIAKSQCLNIQWQSCKRFISYFDISRDLF